MKKLTTFLRSTASLAAGAFRLSVPAVRRVSTLTPREWLSLAGHVIAVATAITATMGIVNFAMPLAGGSLLGQVAVIPIAVFFGCLFQAVVVAAIKLTVQNLPGRPAVAAVCAVVVAVTWMGTVTASYGSYWLAISRDGYEQRATELRIANAAEPLETASDKFDAATASFALVSAHAGRMAALEDTSGLSCGYAAGVGQGDRYTLRMRQKAEAAGISARLTTLNSTLRGSLAKMNAADDAALAQAYRTARGTVLAPPVAEASGWIATQSGGFARGFTADGRSFACTDPEMTRLLAGAATSLKAIPPVPAAPPRNVQISDSQGMLLSIARLFGFGNDPLVRESDFAPFAIPALIEALMTILIVLGEIERPRAGRRLRLSGRDTDPDLARFAALHFGGGGAARLHEIFSGHLIALDGAPKACFVVPREQGPRRDRARKLLVLCSAEQGRGDVLTPYRRALPFSELPPLAVEGWEWRDELCDLHLVPRRDAVRLGELLARQAEAELLHPAHVGRH